MKLRGKIFKLVILVFFMSLPVLAAEHDEDRESPRRGTFTSTRVEVLPHSAQSRPLIFLASDEMKATATRFWNHIDVGKERRQNLEDLKKHVLGYSHARAVDMGKPGVVDLPIILFVLSLTREGRKFLSKFIPILLGENFRILSVDHESSPTKSFIKNAAAVYDEKHRTLYIDNKRSTLKDLLPVFIHEGTHAIHFDEQGFAKTRSDFEVKVRPKMVRLRELYEQSLKSRITSKMYEEFHGLSDEVKKDADAMLIAMIKSEHHSFRAQQRYSEELARLSGDRRFLDRSRYGLHSAPRSREEFKDAMLGNYVGAKLFPAYPSVVMSAGQVESYVKALDWDKF